MQTRWLISHSSLWGWSRHLLRDFLQGKGTFISRSRKIKSVDFHFSTKISFFYPLQLKTLFCRIVENFTAFDAFHHGKMLAPNNRKSFRLNKFLVFCTISMDKLLYKYALREYEFSLFPIHCGMLCSLCRCSYLRPSLLKIQWIQLSFWRRNEKLHQIRSLVSTIMDSMRTHNLCSLVTRLLVLLLILIPSFLIWAICLGSA